MKELVLLIGVLFVTTGMTSTKEANPDIKAGLESALVNFRQVSLKRDVEGIMSFFHQGLFSQMSKEQVKKAMEQAFADGQAPKLKSMEYQYLSPVRSYSQGYAALIGTVSTLTMERPGDVTPEIDALMVGLIKKRMGDEAVITIDETKDQILIKKTSWLLALNEAGTGWKFINKDRIGFFTANNLIPDEVKGLLQ